MILNLMFGKRGRGGRHVVALVALVPAVLAGALPSCARSSRASGGKIAVIASFYPIAEAAERVGGSLVTVTDLTPPGVEPHDLELTPRQLGDMAEADVVLYLGGGFQPAIQDAIGDAGGEAVDVGAGIRRLAPPPGEAEPGLSTDPHVWLDPIDYRAIVDTVARALSRADPSSASTFSANAGAFDERLTALDREYATGLSGCERDTIVTSHAAFGYLAARYGLRQEAISGLAPEVEPTPQRLAALQQFVQDHGVTTIFTEELVSPKVADTLARATGTTTAVLDPLESLTPAEAAAGQDYLSIMRSNLSKLEVALGCG